ncbi:MAG: hypothetical protein FWG84_05375 [Bacteroidales bacterium]|nr:hypothetical protein [Bacteroidales bacterium]
MNKGVIFTKEERRFIVPLLEQRVKFFKCDEKNPGSVHDDEIISEYEILLKKVNTCRKCVYENTEYSKIYDCILDFLYLKDLELRGYRCFADQIIEKYEWKNIWQGL